MPCRINRKRQWTHRIMLEAMLHPGNSFITLTYSEKTLPLNSSGLPILIPKDLQDWLKRLRKEIAPLVIRFYAVGEYGDVSQRPHYHLALFNWPVCSRGRTFYSFSRFYDGAPRCCDNCRILHDTWGKGRIDCGTLEVSSAQYIAGYVTKKMTSKDDGRLNGRPPEFARMSRRPGIGADAMLKVAETFSHFNLEDVQSDVPSALRHGSRLLPLDRYLRRKLRKALGRDEKPSEEALAEIKAQMQVVWDSVFDSTPAIRQAKFKQAMIDQEANKVASMESRARIFRKRSTI